MEIFSHLRLSVFNNPAARLELTKSVMCLLFVVFLLAALAVGGRAEKGAERGTAHSTREGGGGGRARSSCQKEKEKKKKKKESKKSEVDLAAPRTTSNRGYIAHLCPARPNHAA